MFKPWKISVIFFLSFYLFCSGCSTNNNELPNLVAAGDVTESSAILWARASQSGDIEFLYSTDPTFVTTLGSKTVPVDDAEKPAKVKISGLTSGTDYYYKATDSSGKTSSGRFRTLPPASGAVSMHFGAAGDSKGDLIPFYGLTNAASANLDFFVVMGDTIYADFSSPDVWAWQAASMPELRKKYQEVFRNIDDVNYFAQLRASTAIFATIDDHEVANNFSGGAPTSSDLRFSQNENYINESSLYLKGIQAYLEYHPVEDLRYDTPTKPQTHNKEKIYRYRQFGSTASIFILDVRSFRDKPLEANLDPHDSAKINTFLTDSAIQKRTILGEQQLADLKADLLSSENAGTKWKLIFIPVAIQNMGIFFIEDRYEGYAYERNDLLKFIADNNIKNVVFITADMHGTVINNLSYTSDTNVQVPVNAFEIITGPIAFDAPMGYWTVFLGDFYGETNPDLTQNYGSMTPAEKDVVVEELINGQLTPYGYSPIGLEDSAFQSTLVSGNWVATFVYGWTDFAIDQTSQKLTITVYGIEWYTGFDLFFNRTGIANRVPQIYSQFEVSPL